MPLPKSTKLCTHIKVNGHRCGSPSLRGEHFCYFHQRMIRGVRTPPRSRLHPIAMLEDPASIQASLMEVINALVRNTIDARRATLILRALSIAAHNSKNVHFWLSEEKMVTEVPAYASAPPTPSEERTQKADIYAVSQAGALTQIPAPAPRKPAPAAAKAPAARITTAVNPAQPKPPMSARPPATPIHSVAQVHRK